jgi:phosphatidylethanolamine/phosphatidyl-N-methylethanolamine N-methyltransferase
VKASVAFALGALRQPRRVGAIAPASAHLVSAIVEEVRCAPARVVIEAGAGTGAITQQLTQRLPQLKHIIVYECEPSYVALLRLQYPRVETVQECASTMHGRVAALAEPITIISSLPLLSMPKADSQRCIDAFIDVIARQPESRLIQYTYGHPWKPPFRLPGKYWRWRRCAVVLRNLPPATVWALDADAAVAVP